MGHLSENNPKYKSMHLVKTNFTGTFKEREQGKLDVPYSNLSKWPSVNGDHSFIFDRLPFRTVLVNPKMGFYDFIKPILCDYWVDLDPNLIKTNITNACLVKSSGYFHLLIKKKITALSNQLRAIRIEMTNFTK